MASLLSGLLLLGALGLFLAMPGGRLNIARVGWVLLAAAAGILIVFTVQLAAGDGLGWFLACALVALFAAIRVITHKKPVYSALYFVLLIIAVTGLLLLMQAEFLAAALVIVYGGAILVTYVFVIMLAQQAHPAAYDAQSREPFLGCLAGCVLVSVITAQFLSGGGEPEEASRVIAEAAGTVEEVGTLLLTDYVIGIQIAGLLLLAAMVGAIAIARRRPVDVELEGED
ncbi:MAG: NADH-quinone oxidoreductase subunit J [Phycisphaerae bacterium]|nr:NADH-quinone oxidoreductase subunit J [Phycisphaerae bacterium]